MKKTLLTLLFAGATAFLSPNSNAQEYYPPLDSKINPFKQPNQTEKIVWDSLSTREERESLLKKDLAEDSTNYHPYVPGEFVSGDFALQLNMNFYGTSGFNFSPSDTISFCEFDTTHLGRFNVPLYYVGSTAPNWGHGMNAVLVGDNPLSWKDWSFVEPQTDWINVQPGSQSIPLNCNVGICQVYWHVDEDSQNRLNINSFVTFKVVNGVPTLASYDTTRLVLDRTTDVVKRLEDKLPSDFSLSQNYPNPFNPDTKIQYSLKKSSEVSLDVYDVLERKVKTIVNGHMPAGKYETDFNGADLNSGVYFFRLNADGKSIVKKMVLEK